MKMLNMKILFFLFLLLAHSAVASTNSVRLVTLEWEPYIGSALENEGYVAEVARSAFRQSGYSVTIDYMPWARVISQAERADYDGYLPEYYAPELEENYYISEPIPGGPLGFFKRKGEQIVYSRLEDLKLYRFGVVKGYINTEEFDSASYLQVEPVQSDLQNFQKLLRKRIDLVVADKRVGFFVIAKHIPEHLESIEFVHPPLEIKKLYLCISKKTAGAGKKLQAFNKGLKLLDESGQLQKIMAKHGFP